MLKRFIIATVAVFVAWSILDIIIHGVILGDAYAQTAQFWRPMEEMMMWLIYLVSLVSAACMAAVYAWFIRPKSLLNGLYFGLLWGAAAGISMGYGTYSSMPIPYIMAAVWFWGVLIEGAVAGLIAGAIIKEPVASD